MIAIGKLCARLAASTQIVGDPERIVNAVEIDSRAVKPGALFVAIAGERVDGHAYIERAIASGAVAVVVEAARGLTLDPSVTVVHVPNSRRALSAIAAEFYDDPSRALDVVGVTGTNGKTTTTRMIAAILEAAGRPCGVIGTIGAELGTRSWELANTTPLPPELHALLAHMRDAGARAVAMEVSSHALALDRVEDVRFAVGALTNVTRDHLDFHGTFEAYAAAKRRLFALAERAVFNLDDAHGARWHAQVGNRKPNVTYGLDARAADVVALDVEIHASGSRFRIGSTPFKVALPGRFNVSNGLAAVAVARCLDIDDATAARGLASLERVAGRMEHVHGAGIDVVVDYAHTPDALDNALRALRETTGGSLVVVFGCGGDRDRGKRPQMGDVAARAADRVYITSDNPRTEDPKAIIDDIIAGIDMRPYAVEIDRRAAIFRAVREAAGGDVILVAGKGHENYQLVGDRVLPFDDVAVVRDALTAREAAS